MRFVRKLLHLGRFIFFLVQHVCCTRLTGRVMFVQYDVRCNLNQLPSIKFEKDKAKSESHGRKPRKNTFIASLVRPLWF